jgi:hypothetical protein
MVIGLMVSLLAYLLFFVATSVVVVLKGEDPLRELEGWLLVFTIGSVYVGWFVAMVGIAGGALLYMYRVMSDAQDRQE